MQITKKQAILSGLFFGSLGFLAYSPFDFWGVSFLSAIALIWLSTQKITHIALLGVFSWSVAYFALGVNWVHISMIQFGGVPEWVSYLAVLLLATYLALYPLLFSFLIQRFRLYNPWVIAAIWTGTEYLRSVIFTGFPWLQFGYSLIDSPFSGLAPIFGVEGLTFFVILISAQVLQILRRLNLAKKQHHQTTQNLKTYFGFFTLLITAISTQWIHWVEIDKSQQSSSISLIQGNIEQKLKWDPAYFNTTLETYEHLINQALSKSEIIILPESAIPATEQYITPLLQHFDALAKTKGSEMIIGTLYTHPNGIFNSAVALGKTIPYQPENAPRYNKHHLVPFGEYVPFGNLLDWLRAVFILPVNLSQGEFIQKPLTLKNQRFNMAICYEIIFGHQVQQNQKTHNADYLLTISNDAWFGESIGPWQHFQMARMRALELGRPLIRATNTGITAFVDAYGNVEAQAPQFEPTILTYQTYRYRGKTPFSQIGQWGIYALSLFIIMMSFYRRKKATL